MIYLFFNILLFFIYTETTLSEQFILTILGLVAAIIGWIVNQILLKQWASFRLENRNIALDRLNKVYQPLYVLTGELLLKWQNNENDVETKSKISNILENFGHLLSLETQNFVIACLYMKEPDLAKISEKRIIILSEIDKLKNLVYPSYKIFERYYTSSIFGKMKIFWIQVQYKFFSLIVTLFVLLSISYLVVMNYSIILFIIVGYIILGSILYIIGDIKKARILRGKVYTGIINVNQTKSKNEINIPQTSIDQRVYPSDKFKTYRGKYFDLSYPDNFKIKLTNDSNRSLSIVEIEGVRKDCTMVIEVLTGNNLTLDKAYEQNKKLFKPITARDTIIDNISAKHFTSSPNPQIDRHIYLILKDGKLYRIILTWFKLMTISFQPAFEKSLATIKIK